MEASEKGKKKNWGDIMRQQQDMFDLKKKS